MNSDRTQARILRRTWNRRGIIVFHGMAYKLSKEFCHMLAPVFFAFTQECAQRLGQAKAKTEPMPIHVTGGQSVHPSAGAISDACFVQMLFEHVPLGRICCILKDDWKHGCHKTHSIQELGVASFERVRVQIIKLGPSIICDSQAGSLNLGRG